MSLKIEIKDDKHVISFTGRLDTATCNAIHDEVMQYIESLIDPEFENLAISMRPKIVFDMAKVDYISSSLIRLSGEVAKRIGRENLSFVNAGPFVKKILVVAGISNIIEVQ